MKSNKNLRFNNAKIICLVFLILLFLVLNSSIITFKSTLNNEIETTINQTQSEIPSLSSIRGRGRAGTHTVFAEDFTAEWCVHCPSASKTLLDIYNSQTLDFYFVCMITQDKDQNTISDDAQARADEYNLQGYPTVEFDGGYYEVTGRQEDESNYREAIKTCSQRTNIPDIDIDLEALHESEAKINVEVKVTNNDDSEYTGTLRVYIVEIVSRYYNYDGNHYPYGFLDYALEKTVSVSSNDEKTETTSWDGAKITDGLGNDFSDINPDNIIVFATMSNSDIAPIQERNTYSAKALNLHWIDESAAAYLTEDPVGDTSAPVVQITEPTEDEEVTGTVKISAKVTDDGAITKVECKIDSDGIWTPMYHEPSNDEYTRFQDTQYLSDGEHTLTVRALDSGNNQGDDTIDFVIANDMGEPIIRFRKIKDGEEVQDSFTLKIEATDDQGIKKVQYRIDSGPWEDMDFDGFNEYSIEIDTKDLTNGEHEITVEAEDLAGKKVSETITVNVNNIVDESDETKPSTIPGFELLILICAFALLLFSGLNRVQNKE